MALMIRKAGFALAVTAAGVAGIVVGSLGCALALLLGLSQGRQPYTHPFDVDWS
jgi:hypothetical protein